MKITRQGSDVLVLEAEVSPASDPRQTLLIVVGLIVVAVIGGLASHSRQWNELATFSQLAIDISLAFVFLTFLMMVGAMRRTVTCLAFDRTSRKALCVTKSWFQNDSEEFDFDQIKGVVTGLPELGGDVDFGLRLKLVDRPSITLREHGCGPSRNTDAQTAAAVIRDILGMAPDDHVRPKPEPVSRGNKRIPTVELSNSASEASASFSWGSFLVALSMGCFAAGFLAVTAYKTSQIFHWQKTPGIVETVGLSRKTFPRSHGAHGAVQEDRIDIRYRYSVGGVQYVGHRFNIQGNWFQTSETQAIAENYQSGRTCEVFYDPHEPASSLISLEGVQLRVNLELLGAFIAIVFAPLLGADVGRKRQPTLLAGSSSNPLAV